MRIYLIGYMYCGKTTIGRRLANELGYPFVDLDQQFEAHYHTTIPIFFHKYGEEAFRKLEQLMLHNTSQLNNAVISTGGGTPCHFDNIDWINRHGISIYLNVTLDILLQRASNSKKQRPILANKSPEERQTFIQQQLQQRLPYYTQAHITIPADTPDISALCTALQLPLSDTLHTLRQ